MDSLAAVRSAAMESNRTWSAIDWSAMAMASHAASRASAERAATADAGAEVKGGEAGADVGVDNGWKERAGAARFKVSGVSGPVAPQTTA